MTREEVLIAWLCILAHQFREGIESFNVPGDVEEGLIARGWVTLDTEPDWQGRYSMNLTEEGSKVVDFESAEWGIEIELEADA